MPDAYGAVDAVYKTTYEANVQLALQQKPSKLAPLTTNINGLAGEQMQVVELIGSSAAIRNAPDNAETPNIQPKHEGIYVMPQKISWGRTIPSSTKIKAAVDYTSPYVQEGTAAVQRERDAIITDALFGPRLIRTAGQTYPSPVVFDTTTRRLALDYGSTGTNTGLVVKKIVGAIKKLRQVYVDVDMEDLVLLHTAQQNEDLFGQLQVTSKDYVREAVFDAKTVTKFMGVQMVTYEKLPNVTGQPLQRRCMMFCKSGLHFGDAVGLWTRIEPNVGLSYQPHPYMETWCASTRSEDEKFVEILCQE